MTDKPTAPPAPPGPPKPGETPAASTPQPPAKPAQIVTDKSQLPKVKEIGGPEGPEPTRYGDWEVKGIASDF